jgi:hypothetical protein
MTLEKLKEAIDYIFNSAKSRLKVNGRTTNLKRYCLDVNNFRDFDAPFLNICGNKGCTNCREYERMFKEEINKRIEKDFGNEV